MCEEDKVWNGVIFLWTALGLYSGVYDREIVVPSVLGILLIREAMSITHSRLRKDAELLLYTDFQYLVYVISIHLAHVAVELTVRTTGA